MKKLFYLLGLLSLVLSLTANGDEKKLPKLLDLGAHKCIPCKKMAPILEQMEKEYKGVLDVEFIDVWQPENKEKATKHKVETIPTQIFFDAHGNELWRHIGFISKEDMLNKWKELGYEFKVSTGGEAKLERGESAMQDRRSKDQVCYMCDGDIDIKTKVTVTTPKGDVHICSPHELFVMLSCLKKDIVDKEKSSKVTDFSTGKMIPVLDAIYLYGLDEKNGRPTIKAFFDKKRAQKEMNRAGGSLIAYPVLKTKEMGPRCGFCDRSVYPQDAALIKVGPGLHSLGCCVHCALGVASRMNMDIEVFQPDGLTGEMIIIKTKNGSVESIKPDTAVAWFGMRKKSSDKFGSAGCFHQGVFVNQDNLKKWLVKHPLETGKEITINQVLADKIKLKEELIQKGYKSGNVLLNKN